METDMAVEEGSRDSVEGPDVPLDPDFLGIHVLSKRNFASWGIDRVDAAAPSTNGYTGRGVHVYLIDSGIQWMHKEFMSKDGKTSRVIPTLEAWSGGTFYNLCNSSSSYTKCANDGNGHGTHCAGIVGGSNYGVAPGVTIHTIKAEGHASQGGISGLVAALDWIAQNALKPAVVSESQGVTMGTDQQRNLTGKAIITKRELAEWTAAVDRVVESGTTVVLAAGNSGRDTCEAYPANSNLAITVGATDVRDEIATFSNFGPCNDIFAPGADIASASISGGETDMSGTSMATPHVAGAVALLLEKEPNLSPEEVKQKILAAASQGAILHRKKGDPDKLLDIGRLLLPKKKRCPSTAQSGTPDEYGDCDCPTRLPICHYKGRKGCPTARGRWHSTKWSTQYFFPGCKGCECKAHQCPGGSKPMTLLDQNYRKSTFCVCSSRDTFCYASSASKTPGCPLSYPDLAVLDLKDRNKVSRVGGKITMRKMIRERKPIVNKVFNVDCVACQCKRQITHRINQKLARNRRHARNRPKHVRNRPKQARNNSKVVREEGETIY